MDDFRIDSPAFDDSLYRQRQDESRKRSKPRRVEPQDEPTDEVTLSSGGDKEEQPLGYLPSSSGEEPK